MDTHQRNARQKVRIIHNGDEINDQMKRKEPWPAGTCHVICVLEMVTGTHVVEPVRIGQEIMIRLD